MVSTRAPQPGDIVTTIIPTYRRPKLLRRAVMSVLQQTYPHVRAAVLDNASGDETEAVIRELMTQDDRVQYFCQPQNIGSIPNFNAGIAAVKTPFFSLLSDDDALAPDFYERSLAGFTAFPEAMLTCMSTLMVDTENNVISDCAEVMEAMFYPAGAAFEPVIKGIVPGTWTGLVFRLEVPKAIGLVNVEAGQITDALYVWRAMARFPVVALPGIAAALMAHPTNNTSLLGPITGEWRDWVMRMRADINADTAIAPAIRAKAQELVTINFRRTAFGHVARGLSAGQWQYASRAARGLAECGDRIGSIFLRSFIASYRWLPPVRAVTESIRRARKRRVEAYYRELQKKYGHTVSFLYDLDQFRR